MSDEIKGDIVIAVIISILFVVVMHFGTKLF